MCCPVGHGGGMVRGRGRVGVKLRMWCGMVEEKRWYCSRSSHYCHTLSMRSMKRERKRERGREGEAVRTPPTPPLPLPPILWHRRCCSLSAQSDFADFRGWVEETSVIGWPWGRGGLCAAARQCSEKKDDVKCEGEADQFSQRQKPFTNISSANWTLGPRRNCFFIYNYYIFFFLRTSRSDLCLAVLHP